MPQKRSGTDGLKRFTSRLTATFPKLRLLVSLAIPPAESFVAAHFPNFPTSHFLIFISCFQAQAEQKPSINFPGSCAEVACIDAFINSMKDKANSCLSRLCATSWWLTAVDWQWKSFKTEAIFRLFFCLICWPVSSSLQTSNGNNSSRWKMLVREIPYKLWVHFV